MPTISLRLTDAEHAALTRWAHDGRRSLQKEIIWRLFSQHQVGMRSGVGQPIQADAQSRDTEARRITPSPAADPHFKPDFKKGTK